MRMPWKTGCTKNSLVGLPIRPTKEAKEVNDLQPLTEGAAGIKFKRRSPSQTGQLMTQTTLEFLERLRRFVENEASTQYKQLERQWSAPLAERVARGWAIEGVRVEDLKNNILRLSCTT